MNDPILHSMLDDDFYKYTMGSVVYHFFPRALVTYEFFNRGKTPFPTGFAKALNGQIKKMSNLALTVGEADWLKKIPFMRPTYVEWLSGYRMNPDEVEVTQEGGDLKIKITGPWYRTIYWEVKLMAVISELYFIMTKQVPDKEWEQKIENKGCKLQDAGCHWIDFGTRRRFSFEVQNTLVRQMKYFGGFLGTSNPYLAFKHGLTPQGTYAHESVMAMSALYGPRMANKMWMKHWSDYFEGNVGVALTDTFTTDVFLRDFNIYNARLFDGIRQDSGDEYEWGLKVLQHYRKFNIPTTNKRLVFSNALDTDKYIEIDKFFRKEAQPVGGIGTHFTNDVGIKPLNMVIKMTGADFGQGMIPVVKLSDDIGKHTGNPEAIELVKCELNIK